MCKEINKLIKITFVRLISPRAAGAAKTTQPCPGGAPQPRPSQTAELLPRVPSASPAPSAPASLGLSRPGRGLHTAGWARSQFRGACGQWGQSRGTGSPGCSRQEPRLPGATAEGSSSGRCCSQSLKVHCKGPGEFRGRAGSKPCPALPRMLLERAKPALGKAA